MMHKDSRLVWDQGFPYDVLEEAGVTPDSSMREINHADDYFAAIHKVDETRQAMSELEEISKRLFVDFFLYQTEIKPEEGDEIDDKTIDRVIDPAD